MLLVIYNSNPSNETNVPTSRGYRLYNQEDWEALRIAIDNYFFYLPDNDAELSFGLTSYYSYEEWLADYQVSELSEYAYNSLVGSNFLTVSLNNLLGSDFYEPPFLKLDIDILDDDPIYPERDAYA